MKDLYGDFATVAVPESETTGGLRIGMINGALCFGVPGLVAGVEIGGAVGVGRGIEVFLLGGLLLSVIGTIVGIIGVRNRVSSYVLTHFVFGRFGATCLNLAIAAALLGWYGVNMDLFSETVGYLSGELFGVNLPHWVIEIAGGIVMTVSAVFGFRLLQQAATATVPFLALLTLYLGWSGFELLAADGPRTVHGLPEMSNGEAITAVAGGFIVGAVLMADLTRFAKTTRDAAAASFLPFLLLANVAYVCAALAAIAVQQTDIVAVMVMLKMGSATLLLVLLSTWITNVVNLYSCTLSLSMVFRRFGHTQLAIAAGILGTGAALLNVLDSFVAFLFAMSVIFAPIGGILITDFFIVRAGRAYPLAERDTVPFVQWPAIVAWAMGTTAGMLTAAGKVGISGIEIVDALAVAAVCYYVLAKVDSRLFATTAASSGDDYEDGRA